MSQGNSKKANVKSPFSVVMAILCSGLVTACAAQKDSAAGDFNQRLKLEQGASGPQNTNQTELSAGSPKPGGGVPESGGGPERTEAWWEMKTSTEHIVEGNNYFKKGEYQKAEIAYRKALQKDPNNPTAINNLGVILNELGKYDEAIPLLQKAISIDPKNAIAHYVLGKALNQKGRFNEALPEARVATELDPTDPIGYRTLGEAALGQAHTNPSNKSDVDTAIGAFERATDIDDTHDITWLRLGEAYEMKGDYQAQADAIERAIELSPGNVQFRLHRAMSLINLKDYPGAITELNRVLKIDPKNDKAKFLLEQINRTKT